MNRCASSHIIKYSIMKNFLFYLMACLLLVACSKNNGHKDSDPALVWVYNTGFSSGTIHEKGEI